MIFMKGDRARYTGPSTGTSQGVGSCLCPGDQITIHEGNVDPDEYVIVEFRGAYVPVSAEDLDWLESGAR